jgi:hypothetical protein
LASRHRRPLDPDALLRPRNQKSVHVVGVTQFERFFRAAAGLDVDKSDLKRYSDFVNHKIYDLLLRGEAAAKANGRDIIQPFDLPITKGLQESMHEFRKLNEQIELQPIFDHLMAAHRSISLTASRPRRASLRSRAASVLLSPEPSRSSIQT